jgi:DNA-binding winged helix-turn-helix (wHTH) protein/TolB-like protein
MHRMTAPEQRSTPFRLRDRLVTPARNSVQGPEDETGIEPKIMAVLCVLASEPGRVFTRAELIDRVWGAEFGADESLTRAISHLRKALGDTRNEPAVIETIAKRGYRLLPGALEVSPLAQTPVSAEAPHRPNRRRWVLGAAVGIVGAGALVWFRPFFSSAETIPVIVLPVNPLGKEPSEQKLATALTVDLVGALAKDKRLHVTVRRPDSGHPKGIRRYYTYIDLQTADGQLKANAEIMDLDTDQAMWAKLYERSYDGKLSSQDELAAAIARDMTVALLNMARPKP